MKRKILLSASLFITSVNANELVADVWDFPTAEQTIVSQNRVVLFCDANPDKCPVGLSKRGKGVAGSDSGSLVNPNTSTSANNISVVLAGNNSSVNLTTDQDANDSTLSSTSDSEATIDYEEVLNVDYN